GIPAAPARPKSGGQRHYRGDMGWSLSYLSPRDPALLDAVFLSAGRALHLANAFESKCQYVLRIANLIEAVQADPVLTLQEAIEAAPADKMLGGTLRGLTNHSLGVPSEGVAVLDKARKARNFIAHEGASVGTIWTADRDRILGHAIRLRAAVTDLALGDNVISLWCHEIDEPKESRPTLLMDTYPKMIDGWVFGHFGGLLDDQEAGEVVEPSAGERDVQGATGP
ncbi:hypothetical protein, partial [Streptomyces sp. NPDC005407]|uniref:hypothetical protein n=1 Tax=Streptomyces sp. NPDC005407 TaxID=3155340 RepID=UPI00339E2417